MNEWIDVITNTGLQGAALIAMGWYIIRQDNKHEKAMSQMRRTVDNNTAVIRELIMHLKGRDNNG